jgi:hypothetical protein
LGLGALLICVGPFAALGAIAAGALTRLGLGSTSGALRRIRWGEHGLAVLDVPPGAEYTLLIASSSAIADRKRLVQLLADEGAQAFIEPTAYFATHPEPVARTSHLIPTPLWQVRLHDACSGGFTQREPE